jgi:hypothetical protein
MMPHHIGKLEIEEDAMEVRLFADLNILPTMPPETWTNGTIPVPAGNWRVESLMAVACLEPGNLATRDVETMIELNEQVRLRATENGTPQPIISGGLPLTVSVRKKAPMGAVFVRIVLTLEQY